jgi:CBS domain-containing protein
MKASDVMVSNVITARPDATVLQVAELLLSNRISAVPVVDESGKLLGIVSEGDLMLREEAGTERRRSWWLDYITAKQTLAEEYVKSHSRKVADVMTRSVITASPNTSLGQIANTLERNRIKRVPIVADGKVVGIVSRANILQALASMSKTIDGATKPQDSEIRHRVVERLKTEPWQPSMLNVTVHDGTVDLWGMVNSEAERKAAVVAAEITPGVHTVNNNLLIRPPNTGYI